MFKFLSVRLPLLLSFYFFKFIGREKSQIRFHVSRIEITHKPCQKLLVFVKENCGRISFHTEISYKLVLRSASISRFSFWVKVWIVEFFSLESYIFISFGIELHCVVIIIDVFCNHRIGKSIFIHHLAHRTPVCVELNHYLFWRFFLCFQRLIHTHPVYLCHHKH